MRFAVICWIVLEAFVGQIHVFPLSSWMTIQVLGLSRISFLKSYREAVRLEKVQFLVSRWFLKLIFVHHSRWQTLVAACLLLLACCCLPACLLLAVCCCCLLLLACLLFLLFLSHRLLLLLFSLFPSFTQSYSFSNQTIVAEWLLVMQSSAGRRVVCSARGGLSRVCYNGTLYPSNEGNPLVFWWIAVTLLWPGRGDFSASGLSTFKKIALTSALDCIA